MHARKVLSAAALAISLASASLASAEEFDLATGYRTDRYRAPVDRPPEGGAVAWLEDVDHLVRDGAALIDVMPARAGYDPATGRWRLVDRRENIAGSVWLPEVGRGTLDPILETFFRRSLERLTEGRPDRPLIFYCMADCWMSWNAVKRAASFGYRNLHWFPEGTDGWRDMGRPLVEAEPWPVAPRPVAPTRTATPAPEEQSR